MTAFYAVCECREHIEYLAENSAFLRKHVMPSIHGSPLVSLASSPSPIRCAEVNSTPASPVQAQLFNASQEPNVVRAGCSTISVSLDVENPGHFKENVKKVSEVGNLLLDPNSQQSKNNIKEAILDICIFIKSLEEKYPNNMDAKVRECIDKARNIIRNNHSGATEVILIKGELSSLLVTKWGTPPTSPMTKFPEIATKLVTATSEKSQIHSGVSTLPEGGDSNIQIFNQTQSVNPRGQMLLEQAKSDKDMCINLAEEVFKEGANAIIMEQENIYIKSRDNNISEVEALNNFSKNLQKLVTEKVSEINENNIQKYTADNTERTLIQWIKKIYISDLTKADAVIDRCVNSVPQGLSSLDTQRQVIENLTSEIRTIQNSDVKQISSADTLEDAKSSRIVVDSKNMAPIKSVIEKLMHDIISIPESKINKTDRDNRLDDVLKNASKDSVSESQFYLKVANELRKLKEDLNSVSKKSIFNLSSKKATMTKMAIDILISAKLTEATAKWAQPVEIIGSSAASNGPDNHDTAVPVYATVLKKADRPKPSIPVPTPAPRRINQFKQF